MKELKKNGCMIIGGMRYLTPMHNYRTCSLFYIFLINLCIALYVDDISYKFIKNHIFNFKLILNYKNMIFFLIFLVSIYLDNYIFYSSYI